MAEKNNLVTASYDQIKDKIKPGEFTTNVNSSMGSKFLEEEIISGNQDNSASYDSFYKNLNTEGFNPRQVKKDGHMDNYVLDSDGNPVIDYSKISDGMNERMFYNKYGELVDSHFTSGTDAITTDPNTGDLRNYSEFNLGPYQFHTDPDGNFIDQDGTMWDEEIIRNAWDNLQKRAQAVHNAGSTQEAWEAHMPLAYGDTPEGKAANQNQTWTFNEDTGVYEGSEIYVGSSDEYLTKRSDINHELNRPKSSNKTQGFLARALDKVKGIF